MWLLTVNDHRFLNGMHDMGMLKGVAQTKVEPSPMSRNNAADGGYRVTNRRLNPIYGWKHASHRYSVLTDVAVFDDPPLDAMPPFIDGQVDRSPTSEFMPRRVAGLPLI